jgi:hypothetical protein
METLKQAILGISERPLPDGFDVSDDAPQTFERERLAHSGNRKCVVRWIGRYDLPGCGRRPRHRCRGKRDEFGELHPLDQRLQ